MGKKLLLLFVSLAFFMALFSSVNAISFTGYDVNNSNTDVNAYGADENHTAAVVLKNGELWLEKYLHDAGNTFIDIMVTDSFYRIYKVDVVEEEGLGQISGAFIAQATAILPKVLYGFTCDWTPAGFTSCSVSPALNPIYPIAGGPEDGYEIIDVELSYMILPTYGSAIGVYTVMKEPSTPWYEVRYNDFLNGAFDTSGSGMPCEFWSDGAVAGWQDPDCGYQNELISAQSSNPFTDLATTDRPVCYSDNALDTWCLSPGPPTLGAKDYTNVVAYREEKGGTDSCFFRYSPTPTSWGDIAPAKTCYNNPNGGEAVWIVQTRLQDIYNDTYHRVYGYGAVTDVGGVTTAWAAYDDQEISGSAKSHFGAAFDSRGVNLEIQSDRSYGSDGIVVYVEPGLNNIKITPFSLDLHGIRVQNSIAHDTGDNMAAGWFDEALPNAHYSIMERTPGPSPTFYGKWILGYPYARPITGEVERMTIFTPGVTFTEPPSGQNYNYKFIGTDYDPGTYTPMGRGPWIVQPFGASWSLKVWDATIGEADASTTWTINSLVGTFDMSSTVIDFSQGPNHIKVSNSPTEWPYHQLSGACPPNHTAWAQDNCTGAGCSSATADCTLACGGGITSVNCTGANGIYRLNYDDVDQADPDDDKYVVVGIEGSGSGTESSVPEFPLYGILLVVAVILIAISALRLRRQRKSK